MRNEAWIEWMSKPALASEHEGTHGCMNSWQDVSIVFNNLLATAMVSEKILNIFI